MTRTRAVILFLAFAFVGIMKSVATESSGTQEDESAFVDAFLNSEFDSIISEGVPLVIESKLSIRMLHLGKDVEEFTQQLMLSLEREGKDTILREAAEDFCERSAEDVHFESIWTLAINHIVLREQELSDLFNPQNSSGKYGWDLFHTKFPKSPGIITLSRPGFSADGKTAVIYMGDQKDYLAGKGQIYVFRKKDGQWVKSKEIIGPTWIS